MRKFTHASYKTDKSFIFRLENQIMERSLLDQIDDWANEANLDICYYMRKVAKSEINIIFGFLSEEDFSMFVLRWYDIIETEYRNTLTYHFTRMILLIREK